MASLFRRSALIVSATLCSAALLSVIILSTIALTAYGSTPAEFLPGETTIALLHGANDALTPLWLKRFSPPDTGSINGKTIAMLRSPTGNDIVTFERKTRGRTFAHTVGAYGISLSRPDLLPTIVKKTQSLATLPAYRALVRSFPPKASWIFLKAETIPQASSMMDHILSATLIGGNAEGVGLAAGNGTWELSTYAPARKAVHASADARIPFAENPFFVLSAGNIQRSFRNTLAELPENTAAILEGLVAQELLDLFGPDVSLAYDIEPLLEKPASLQLTDSGETTAFLLAGHKANGKALIRHLERLHRTFASSIPTIAIGKRTLDDRFTATDVRDDAEPLSTTHTEPTGWAVTVTRDLQGGRMLASAVRNDVFLLSNSEKTLRDAMEKKDVPLHALSRPAGVRLAAGSADMTRLGALLERTLPDGKRTVLPFSGSIRWSVERAGPVTHTTLSEEPAQN